MASKVHFSLTSIGFLFVVATYSFLGCYGTRTTDMGKCEDDGNPCTIDSCESGGTLHVNAPDNAVCTLGENAGKCNMGRCVLACEMDPTQCKCTMDTQCPSKEDCAEWTCNTAAGQCQRTPTNEGLSVGMQTDGDCKKVVCQGGEYATTNDDTDVGMSDGCSVNTCVSGTPSTMPANLGTTCSSGVCDGKGMCVDCLSSPDWATCGSSQCPVKLCNGEASTDSTNCRSGFVADGVCCDTACTEVCKSCNVMGATKGVCSNIPYYQPDPSYIPQGGGSPAACDFAAAASFCDGMGKCLRASGASCQVNAQCISGTCTPMFKCLGAPGEACIAGVDCVSGTCMMGSCK